MSYTDFLIFMTRLPCVGKNKTRLIPALGAAATARCRSAFLSELKDVDVPDDLPTAETELAKDDTIPVSIPTIDV